MIKIVDNYFVLETENTSYIFEKTKFGHLKHLYYGKKLFLDLENYPQMLNALSEKCFFPIGNTNLYSEEDEAYSLENMSLEISTTGKGDLREAFVEVINTDGSFTSDFIFDSYVTGKGKVPSKMLPGSYDDTESVDNIKIIYKDKENNLELITMYYVYEKENIITRTAKLINHNDTSVRITKLLSAQVDFDDHEFIFSTFNGAWTNEMNRHDTKLQAAKVVNSTIAGTSSNRANPFVMLSDDYTSEDKGKCYGFNLIYSGNHYECAEVGSYGKLRFLIGINPQNFSYKLEKDEEFEAPEAVMTFSDEGYNGMSQNMHQFINNHIIRQEWKRKTRPVVINSWEAAYFNIDEAKLVKLAKTAKDVGAETFVMDDGWFGTRNDDKQSLGDWYENKKKLPGGLKQTAEKIKNTGLDFGIWVEPEMVNINSELYRKHPDWAIQIPGKMHSEGRHQRILDLTRIDVQNYIIDEMSRVFSSADISFVKWDMNRTFTDYYSSALETDRQQEVSYRYITGLYRVLKELMTKFPDILFEGCASGGNRFDLGMLCFFPQIWVSDNTDALCRQNIQQGLSYGYPLSVMSNHISDCPNHQTLRITPLNTRFNVAAFGIMGLECNLCDMSKENKEKLKEYISQYKKKRELFQFGKFYRGRNFCSHKNQHTVEWIVVSDDKEEAVGMIMQDMVSPGKQTEKFTAKGLKKEYIYHFYNDAFKINIKEFGNLVNTMSPVHIRPDSAIHNIAAHFVKLDGEKEDYNVSGDILMETGVFLRPAYTGTGFSADVRHFPDFASRMYYIDKI